VQVPFKSVVKPFLDAPLFVIQRAQRALAARTTEAPEEAPVETALDRLELAREIRARIGAPPEIVDPPLVSIVVLNRNGKEHLRRLLDGLLHSTDYPRIELVLVDNGSTDGSPELVSALDAPFPVKVVRNKHNASFSEGNNQGAEIATGDLLLFLNNDVEPLEPGWLRELIDCQRRSGAAAVGAILVHASPRPGETPSGWAVQHRGIRFKQEEGRPRGFNLGDGEDALGDHLGRIERHPCATAACLLVEPELFRKIGTFHTGYRYGTEDIDLCLSALVAGREVRTCGRAVLLHRESSTQEVEGADFQRVNRLGNRQLFLERWGPRLHREIQLDRLIRGGYWTEGPPMRLAITRTSNDPQDGWGDWYTAEELGGALAGLGWDICYLQARGGDWYKIPEGIDHVLTLLDRFDASRVPAGVGTIAWIRNWTDRWVQRPYFDAIDVVLVSSARSAEIVERHTRKTTIRFPLATNPERFAPRPPEPSYAADYVFTGNRWGQARDIEQTLEVRPGETFLLFGRGWEEAPAMAPYRRGPVDYDAVPLVYSSAKLVIDDTAGPTASYGALNCRVFDALASGTLVVTDCEAGARELIGDALPTYAGRDELRAQLDALLGDDDRRRELAERCRAEVLERHTYAHRAQRLRGILAARAEALGFCIKIGAPTWEEAHTWGDLHYADALKRELGRRGHRCRIQVLEEWDSLDGLVDDVAIHLKGLMPYRPKPGQLNVLWSISHPETVTGAECDAFDLVCVASERFAERLRRQTRTRVEVLEQATDPQVFFPDPDPAFAHELVFVGNSRAVRRRLLADLLPTDRDLAVWGTLWDGLIDPRHLAGEFLTQDEVRKVYSSAAIVFNDHWDGMRQEGFVSNRVYDALACGALVISDHLDELSERFGDAVVTYRTREELAGLIDRYLARPDERERKGREGRRLVLAEHTFAQRVDALLELVGETRAEINHQLRVASSGPSPDLERSALVAPVDLAPRTRPRRAGRPRTKKYDIVLFSRPSDGGRGQPDLIEMLSGSKRVNRVVQLSDHAPRPKGRGRNGRGRLPAGHVYLGHVAAVLGRHRIGAGRTVFWVRPVLPEFSALADAFRPDFVLADLTGNGTLPLARDLRAWGGYRDLVCSSDLVLVDDDELRTVLREDTANVDSVPAGGVDSILDMLERRWITSF
jgi:O-antigen biosynthesis protein